MSGFCEEAQTVGKCPEQQSGFLNDNKNAHLNQGLEVHARAAADQPTQYKVSQDHSKIVVIRRNLPNNPPILAKYKAWLPFCTFNHYVPKGRIWVQLKTTPRASCFGFGRRKKQEESPKPESPKSAHYARQSYRETTTPGKSAGHLGAVVSLG